MGGYQSSSSYSQPRIRVLCIGLANTGKTGLINNLIFGQCLTPIPTFGRYEMVYAFPSSQCTFDLCEYGSRVRDKWNEMYKLQNIPAHAIILFVNATDSRERLDASRSALLQFLKDTSDHLPVIFIHNVYDTDTDTKNVTLNFAQRNRILQLKQLRAQKTRPVFAMEMNTFWPTPISIQRLFCWIVDKHKREPR